MPLITPGSYLEVSEEAIALGALRVRGGATFLDMGKVVQAEPSVSANLLSIWQSNDNRIYADGEQGVVDPGNAPTGAVSGWYFDNPLNLKVNWYESNINPRFADWSGYAAWVRYDNINSLTYLAVYTMPQNDGNDRASWYRSRVILLINSAGNVAQYEDCIATFRSDPSGVDPSLQRLSMTVDPATTLYSTGSSSLEDIADEVICLMAFSTSSNRPAGSDQFLLRNWWAGVTVGGEPNAIVYQRDMAVVETGAIVVTP